MKKRTPLFLPIIRRIQESGKVQQATFSFGPQLVARLFLTPSKFSLRPLPSMLSINGVYRLPLDSGPAAMARIFIQTINQVGRNTTYLSEMRFQKIIDTTIKRTRRLYPDLTVEMARVEFNAMISLIRRISSGDTINVQEPGYTLHEWAQVAVGPERVDLMLKSVKHNGRRICNADCGACYASDLETREISTFGWLWIIFRLWRCGVSQLTFTGGEPTLRKDLVRLVAAAKRYTTRLNTNGFLLTPKLVKELVRAELDMAQVTFYSSDAKVHNILMGHSSAFNLSLNGIDNAVNGGLNVSVNIPIEAQNAAQFPDTIRLLHRHGIRWITCSGLIPAGGALVQEAAGNTLNATSLYETVKAGVVVSKALGVDLRFTSPGQLSDKQLTELGLPIPYCGAGLINMAVRPDGQVVPCQSWINKPVGSLIWKPWASIWKHPLIVRIRTHFALRNHCPMKEELS